MESLEFSIETPRASMPSSCWGKSHYYNVRLVDNKGAVYFERKRLYWGTSGRSACDEAIAHAIELRIRLERRQIMRCLALQAGAVVESAAELPDDCVAVRKRGSPVVQRFDSSWRLLGVAVRLPEDLRERFGEWEHGETTAQCRREIEHKRQVLAQDHREARSLRAIRLVARLCPRLVVTFEDARAAGMCKQGIESFCSRFGLSTVSATAEQIRATGVARALDAIQVAAKRLVVQRFPVSHGV